ncbi:hypothetical protein DYQ86_07415 [Acidobacteria bacterium AB60]|nr:hypothetical protein DYQ86_07415 [Acidobacteria bacterium AB60]
MILADLALLGYRLLPWDQVLALPGNGATGLDPAVTLLGYIGVSWWVGSARNESARRCLFSAAWLGVFAGVLLAGAVLVSGRPGAAESGQGHGLQYGLMAATVLLWGIAGARGVRAGYGAGFAMLCALWSAMVSCLMGFAALIGGSFYSYAPGQTADPWKQYEGLAIGSEATQALVKTLLTGTGYLLLGPLVALVAGLVFAGFTKPAKG